ncbi:hypothetical protein Desmu_0928 [Desulfurococcus mucosus DSM 2162]|uniref:Uncharacterized protein n=1 Tax=Desulfurococcus mucosus (strain ATCC 35584 / DSM 2162 / JCM 9187 / O7/1) TaxID=765177 RepID=E8R9Q5_DESM0|nr:hypothetical protein Desmu_0928 [Desulfurococcus mucosus DSM 2162]
MSPFRDVYFNILMLEVKFTEESKGPTSMKHRVLSLKDIVYMEPSCDPLSATSEGYTTIMLGLTVELRNLNSMTLLLTRSPNASR